MAGTNFDPSIIQIEARLVKSPEEWLPASIRFTAGKHHLLLEGIQEAVHDLKPSETAGFRLLYPMGQLDELPYGPHRSLLNWAIEAGFQFERDPREVKHLRLHLKNGDVFECFCYPSEFNRKPGQPDDFFHFFVDQNDVEGKSIQWKFVKGWTDIDEERKRAR